MADIAKQLNQKQLGQAIDQTLINLRVSFTPEDWTEEERNEIREELDEIEDLAKRILAKSKQAK